MNESNQYCCCCTYDNKSNKNNGYRRTIRNNTKIDNWNARNNSVQVNAAMSPDNYAQSKSECSNEFFEALPDEVTKTTGKIKWVSGTKKPPTNSRYHAKCFSKKQPKPKFKKPSNIKRNIVSSAYCSECGAETHKRKFKNECYCNLPPEKPFLPVKPAVTQPNPKRTIKSGYKSPDGEIESNHTLQTLRKAKNLLQDYCPESEFLKRLQKEAKEVYDCHCSACKTKEETAGIQFTKQRQLLEEAYEEVEKNKQFSSDEIARQCHKCEINSCICNCGKCEVTPKFSPRYATLFTQNSVSANFASSPKNSPIMSPNYSPNGSNLIDCNKIHEIKHIRDDNFFETHSTNVNLAQKDIPNHTCVHKFTLDKRLLPKPLNADGFGVSRCTVCNKAMDNTNTFDEEYVYVADEKSSKTSLKPKEEKIQKIMQASPRQINFAGKKNVIELRVPPILITDRKDFKLNKIAPNNTWALRYQKGVI